MNKFLIALLLLSGFLASAQPAGYSPLKDAAGFQAKFSEASRRIESIESDFTQVKNLAMLKDKISSKGKFYYKKANKVRIEYLKPYSYLMVLNSNDMKVQDEQKTSSYNTRSNKIMQSVNTVMLDCMRGTVYSNREFSTAVYEGSKDYLLLLRPTASVVKKLFARIEVYLDKNSYDVLRLNMVENGGDNSLMSFHNRVMNKTLDDALFRTK